MTDDISERLRRAFDADSVAEKNLAIRAAFDFIAAMQPAPQWQGIESAPRNGTSVLLLIDGLAIEGDYDDKTMPNGYKYGEGAWDLVSLPSHGCGCCSFDNPEPTHWMPLPTPPAGGSGAT